MPDNRNMPMNWVPRWTEANYSTDSVLRKLYFLGIYYYSDLMKQLMDVSLMPKFFGAIGSDSYLFIAKYHFPKDSIPVINFVTPASSIEVRAVDSLGSLLYDLNTASYCREENVLFFKNLDTYTTIVSSISGYVSLTGALSGHPLYPDSPIILTNSYGDSLYIDQTFSVYFAASGHIQVPYEDTYTISYRSSTLVSRILSSTNYISIDEELIPLSLTYIENVWDKFAYSLNIKRNKWESNELLKTRSQHLTIAKKPNQKIAATLGATIGISWYTSGSVNASGYNDWQFQDYDKSYYIEKERPIKDGNNFVLTYPPTGHVQIFLNGNLINEDSYTVSGSYILSNTDLLRQTTQNNLTVSYKHQRLDDRNYPETGNISATNPDGLLYKGILVKDDVVITNIIKKIEQKDWKWNKQQGSLGGLADFDF